MLFVCELACDAASALNSLKIAQVQSGSSARQRPLWGVPLRVLLLLHADLLPISTDSPSTNISSSMRAPSEATGKDIF